MSSNALPQSGTAWSVLRASMLADRGRDRPWHGPRMFIGGSYFSRDDVVEVANDAFGLFMNCNQLYAPRLFDSLVRYERDITSYLLRLLNAPPGGGGCITTGGTESLLLAVHAAIERGKSLGLATSGQNIVVPHAAHPGFDKAAALFGVECRRAPRSVAYAADIEAMATLCDDGTVLIAGSAPSYPFGVCDDICALAELGATANAWLHVDACHGGMIYPFAARLGREVPPFDLGVTGVHSVSVDVHKLGYSNKGVSALLLTERTWGEFHRYRFDRWPAGHYETASIAGSRSAGGIASAWAVMNYLGEVGYLSIAESILDARDRLMAGIASRSGLEILGDPTAYILCFACQDADIFAVDELMTGRGWVENRTLQPEAIHLFLDGSNRGSVDIYLSELDECVARVRDTGGRAMERKASYTRPSD